MNSFDTLKISIPLENCSHIPYKLYDKTHTTNDNFILKSSYYHVKRPKTGISYIHIDLIRKIVIIELSAKILGFQYKNNINAENFINVLELILKSEYLYFIPKKILNKILFYRADVSKNIFIQSELENYLSSLSYFCNSKKVNVQTYKNQSVTFCINPLSKRRKIRSIFYDKYTELKKDKNFCKTFDVNTFQNVLRYELNINNFFLFRKLFNIDKHQKLDYYNVIESKQNVLKNNFIELINFNQKSGKTFEFAYSTEKLSAIEKKLGAIEICKSFNFDFQKVQFFLKRKLKGNLSNYFNFYRQICLNNNPEVKNTKFDFYINQIYKNVA